MVKEFPLPILINNYKTFKDVRGSFKILHDDDKIPLNKELLFLYGGYWSGYDFQENVSISKPGVLRGMHWQEERPQSKLVKVLYGKVLDVVVDIRKDSPTFRKVFSYELTEDNGEQLFIPRGFAHGFYNHGNKDAVFHYNIDNIYYPKGERGLLWSSIDFEWPSKINDNLIISEKDKVWPKIDDIDF